MENLHILVLSESQSSCRVMGTGPSMGRHAHQYPAGGYFVFPQFFPTRSRYQSCSCVDGLLQPCPALLMYHLVSWYILCALETVVPPHAASCDKDTSRTHDNGHMEKNILFFGGCLALVSALHLLSLSFVLPGWTD